MLDQATISDISEPISTDSEVSENLHNESQDQIKFCDPKTLDIKTFGNARKDKPFPQNLEDSIKATGVRQSVIARVVEDGTLQLLAGFTRVKIALKHNLDTVPVVIVVANDSEALEIHLHENLCRSDLTISEEARAAARLTTVCEGDKEEAANRLGWTAKKLKDRLQLNRLTDQVLDAIDDKDIKVSLGHGIILSSFNTTVQNNTLKKIIDENWSVDTLKAKAVAKNRPISEAKFDTTECEACPHNTVHQRDMFSTGIDTGATCAFNKCFKDKTVAWLETQKAIAEEKFGKVLFLFESNDSDRNTVSASSVGSEQLTTCNTCESNVVIMDDSINNEGKVITNQCVDKVCFNKCVSAYKKAVTAPSNEQVKSASAPNGKATPDTNSKTVDSNANVKAKKTEPVNLGKTSSATEKCEQLALSATTFGDIKSNESLPLAYLIAMVAERKMMKFDGKAKEVGGSIAHLLTKSPEELAQLAKKLVLAELATNKGEKEDKTTPVGILLDATKGLTNGEALAIKAWQPTTDWFNSYTISGISALCKESGFLAEFNRDEENIEKKITFSSLSKGGKGEFIKAVLAYEFDWSAYAPASMKAKGK